MNRELYIHTLRMLREQYEIARMDTVVETIDAALAEFERPTDGDCIRRQAILSYIDRVMSQGTGKKKSLEFVRKHAEKMPSAQPDKEALDDAYAHGYTYAESKYRAMMSDGDYISRQAAIDAVRDRMGKGETNIGDTFIECFEMILNALPSAQPEPQWIPCSDCERRCEKWEHSKTLQE